MPEPFDHSYFNWLCAKIIPIDSPGPFYWQLLKTLHETEFVWIVPLDKNRAEDGLELRSSFLMESGMEEDPDWRQLGCSVLEMMVAFSKRAWFQTERSPKEWFWEFIANLGLSEMTDANIDAVALEETLNNFVWRTYGVSGRGGMFPLKKPQRDQRKLEIWRQFFDYLEDTDRLL